MGVHGLRKLRARALRRDVGHAQAPWGMAHLREHARLLLNGMQWVGGSGERHHADAQHFPRTACPSYSAYAHGSRHSQRVPVSRA